MAAFDPIEYSGIRHDVDMPVSRHSRKRRHSSISLSSVEVLPRAVLEESSPRQHLVPVPSRRPRSRSHSFVNLTPEHSVVVLGFDVGEIDSQSQPPNVSSNSSWTSAPSQPTPLGRYLNTPDRREQIALSLSAGSQHRPGSNLHSFSLTSTVVAHPDDAEHLSVTSQSPMNRFLSCDLENHEWLAVALEQPRQPPNRTPDEEDQCPSSSISLSNDSGADDGDSQTAEMLIAKLYVVP